MKEIYEDAIKPMLPKHFDQNEWFTIAITILVIASVYYITVKSRKLLWSQIICISLLNMQLTTVGDYFFAMPPYDFYDTVDRNSGELADIILQNIVYPGTILYFMHLYKRVLNSKLLFILLCVGMLTVFEAVSVHLFNLFTYKSWKLAYSIGFYAFVMILNVVFYEKLNAFLEKRIGKEQGDGFIIRE
ncbi:hypothetical protein [Bacillus sp. SG-1]|uniref:hypothetical protein n=1 Tax=Bacillus sp. SG-1 TaxID=161544 RepID=UPI0001544336|nr:hypothetical protein [Bacillus sp. SG-1]EDL66637.1 hypothetical protein BSG1_04755 [Bacillus sp. SG-1]